MQDGLKKIVPQLCKLTTDQGTNGIGSVNGDRLYESMNDFEFALSSGPLEFPMVGWPYYVTNPTRELSFYYYYFLTRENDLLLPKATGYSTEEVADISFVGLNYRTMNEIWQLNQEI